MLDHTYAHSTKYEYPNPECHDEHKQDSNSVQPFHISQDVTNDPLLANLEKIPSSKCMPGNDNQNLLVAAPEGSNIFAKFDLNYMEGNTGADRFFFSMCSTKNYASKASVIHNFEPGKDKIHIFCTKKIIMPEDVHVDHFTANGTDISMLHIDTMTGDVAIAVLGNHDLTGDIVYNQKYLEFCPAS